MSIKGVLKLCINITLVIIYKKVKYEVIKKKNLQTSKSVSWFQMEPISRIELLAYGLRIRRSTNWAILAFSNKVYHIIYENASILFHKFFTIFSLIIFCYFGNIICRNKFFRRYLWNLNNGIIFLKENGLRK